MERKLVSAIIITHNRPYMIVLRAIKSVVNQTYHQIEIIVVDDSTEDYFQSHDLKRKIQQEFSHDVLYIRHSLNRGACAARNIGLSYAKGYYIAFLDDDDEWIPEKIEKQIIGFTNDKIGLVYCNTRVIDEIRNITYTRPPCYKKGNVFEILLKKGNFIGGTSNPLIKRSCLVEVGGFDIKMVSWQDYDVWLRIAKKYPINFIKESLVKYYIYEGDRISSDPHRIIDGCLCIIKKYEQYLYKNNQLWYSRYRILIPQYIKMGMREEGFSLWLKCVKKSPFSIIKNIRHLVLITFGYDSFFSHLYFKTKEVINCIIQTQ